MVKFALCRMVLGAAITLFVRFILSSPDPLLLAAVSMPSFSYTFFFSTALLLLCSLSIFLCLLRKFAAVLNGRRRTSLLYLQQAQ